MTGYSGTQFQSSLIQSNSDACKLLSIVSGRNILTKEGIKKSYSEIKKNKKNKQAEKNDTFINWRKISQRFFTLFLSL